LDRDQTVPNIPAEGFLKKEKKVSELFDSWKEFCQDKFGEGHQDDDDNDEDASSKVLPPKTSDKGMPRELPVDDDGHAVLPLLNAEFKSAVPGFVRQEMFRSWMTYWYRMLIYFF